MINSTKSYFALALFSISTLLLSSCDLSGGTNTGPQRNIIETVQSYSDLEDFVQAVEDAGLTSYLEETGPFTVFPPTDGAFDDLPSGMQDTLSTDQLAQIVEYHVIEDEIFGGDFDEQQTIETKAGEELFIVIDDSIYVNEKAAVIAGNIQTTNGLLHAVNQVLLPDNFLSVSGVISKRYTLQSFEEGLQEAGLKSTLSEQNQNRYTIFAASETAFENDELPEDQQQLEEQLNYHIIPGKVSADELEDGQTLETRNGKEISIEREGDTITINGKATLTQTNLQGTNGFVHIIDSLLNPSAQ